MGIILSWGDVIQWVRPGQDIGVVSTLFLLLLGTLQLFIGIESNRLRATTTIQREDDRHEKHIQRMDLGVSLTRLHGLGLIMTTMMMGLWS